MASHDGRYAPSPSGPLHLGNLRTALLAWLFARSRGARFILRIEDLDPLRSRPEHEHRAIGDLRLLGLDWEKYVKYDARYERPAEVELLIGNPAKARKQLGWEPKVKFKELVKIMVEHDLEYLFEDNL